MKNVQLDMNVMILQIQTYVHLVQTQLNSDRQLVRFVILDSTVQSQQILTNVLLRLVFELISIFKSFADWLGAQPSIHPFENPNRHMRQEIEQCVLTVNLDITACLDFNSNVS